MIHGIGIDVMEVERFKAALDKWGDKLESRLFTEEERVYARAQKHPERHFAARFAAKVSLHKALGNFIPYKDVEVRRTTNGSPEFSIKKGFDAEVIALNVSISHHENLAIAETIAERLGE